MHCLSPSGEPNARIQVKMILPGRVQDRTSRKAITNPKLKLLPLPPWSPQICIRSSGGGSLGNLVKLTAMPKGTLTPPIGGYGWNWP